MQKLNLTFSPWGEKVNSIYAHNFKTSLHGGSIVELIGLVSQSTIQSALGSRSRSPHIVQQFITKRYICTCTTTICMVYMRILVNHKCFVGCKQPQGLDVNQSLSAQDTFRPIPDLISCAGVWALLLRVSYTFCNSDRCAFSKQKCKYHATT